MLEAIPNRPRDREMSVFDPAVLGDTKVPPRKFKDLSRASKPKLQFIACSGTTGQPSDLEKKKAIRRHVMQGLPRLRKHHDPNRIEIYIPPSFSEVQAPPIHRLNPSLNPFIVAIDNSSESSPRLTQSPTPRSSSPDSLEDEDARSISPQLSPASPVSILGQGRVDPFAKYPIKMNKGERWLIDQIYTGEDLTFKNFRERWLPLAINDPATFHQFLANVSLNISRLRGSKLDDLVTVAHHSLAIRCVSSKLSDPVLRISDSVLASIVTFVCYSVVIEDFKALTLHLNGLDEAITLRGGLEELEANRELAALVYGVDISGATRQDSRPRFPLRKEFIQTFKYETVQELEFQRLAVQLPAPWKQIFPRGHQLNAIFADLTSAIAHSAFKTTRKVLWRDVDFILYWLDPIMHKLLCLRSELTSPQEEVRRLGIILFMGPIRRNCGKLGVSSKTYVRKLKALLLATRDEIDWTPKTRLLLWVLFFGMLETWRQPEQGWYVSSLCLTAKGLGLNSWDEVIESVSHFLWMENIFEADLDRFQDIVAVGLPLA